MRYRKEVFVIQSNTNTGYQAATYNNCFVLGGISKLPCYIKGNELRPLNKKNQALLPLWSRSYTDVIKDIKNFVAEPYYIGDKEIIDFPTVSLYLENAMYGNLNILVIDIDTKHETPFTNRVIEAADFYTISKNNGKHAYFGVSKDKELFDSINILASSNATAFISKTGLTADDGTKFDVFCDAPHFIYEWQKWGNRALSDKTQIVFDLLKDIKITRSVEYERLKDAEGKYIVLEALDENELKSNMNERQAEIFNDLLTISSDCNRQEWFSIGCDIHVVFGYELGGSVWLYWSRESEKFQPQSCANTWDIICGKENDLRNRKWQEILEVNAFDIAADRQSIQRQLAELAEQSTPIKEEHRKQAEAKIKEIHAEFCKLEKEEQERKELAAKGLFIFGDLLIKRQEDSTRFLLPNENNAALTAYDIIELLAGQAFKSYTKQIKYKNGKIQILPYAERIRLVFFFREYDRQPPPLDNAKDIVAFINTARKYTSNIELDQNWLACLDVCNSPLLDFDAVQATAASLLVHYGWAQKHNKEYPIIENSFYTVEKRTGERRYDIVNDDITLRFRAIESKGRTLEVFNIITDRKKRLDRYNDLQSIFKPLLWKRDGVGMGLTGEARELCDTRIMDYINELLNAKAADGISLEEQINKIEIDKSETNIEWAKPRQFTISMNDMDFEEYTNKITAEYNRENNANKGQKKAAEKFSRLTGDEWNTDELKAQGYAPQQIKNYCGYKWIAEVPGKKKGNLKYYRRISS